MSKEPSSFRLKRLPTRQQTPHIDYKHNRDLVNVLRTATSKRRQNSAAPAEFGIPNTQSYHKKRLRNIGSGMNPNSTAVKRKTNNIDSSNARCAVRVGDIVCLVQQDGGADRLAKVSELSTYHDNQFAVVCVWLYKREEIVEDLIAHGTAGSRTLTDDKSWRHINERWDMKQEGFVGGDYMLSTKRTIVLWDTALIRLAPEGVSTRVCQNLIYDVNLSSREICDVNNPAMHWMKKILLSRPAGFILPDAN
ncbi:hypothetical protein BGW36DRAFT_355743 [Talaromyces proteolyticus]|uniref:BAH domain-containing protein n=1 Tax=Talaromyces proteolyticus TaxID=1131652 RepID=A0AAD4KWB1_9EURO|nr:uncharacterized protein BGW36DRAFT_355743 [Talaromyces proteolyticus]KAH8701589.1 hypothetical protein BGW36DRAFT_355743 [Talaromyces proteolyticus]